MSPRAELEPDYTEWVHALNASDFRPGDVFGWHDKRSERSQWRVFNAQTSEFYTQHQPFTLHALYAGPAAPTETPE